MGPKKRGIDVYKLLKTHFAWGQAKWADSRGKIHDSGIRKNKKPGSAGLGKLNCRGTGLTNR